MRSWTIIVSAGLHGLAALVLATVHVGGGSDVPARRVEDTIVPLEVAMVDSRPLTLPSPTVPTPTPEPEASKPPPTEPAAERPPRSRPDAPAATTPHPATGEAPAASEPSRSLHMRHDSPAGPPGHDREDPVAPFAPPPVPAPGEGGWLVDGTSAGDAAHAYGLQIGAPIVNMLQDPFEGLHERGDSAVGHHVGGGRYEKKTPQFRADIASDGKVHFHDSPFFSDPSLYADPESGTAGASVHFDITDALMRAHGMDPYWSAKLAYLEETSDERNGMAVVDRGNKIRESLARLPVFLDKVWRDTRYPAAERRLVLFQLWDECAESGPDDIVRAGDEVRSTIEAFVRRRLAEGSADAYPADELDALNAKRGSKRAFRPYTAAP